MNDCCAPSSNKTSIVACFQFIMRMLVQSVVLFRSTLVDFVSVSGMDSLSLCWFLSLFSFLSSSSALSGVVSALHKARVNFGRFSFLYCRLDVGDATLLFNVESCVDSVVGFRSCFLDKL